jgi:hypothetical protein
MRGSSVTLDLPSVARWNALQSTVAMQAPPEAEQALDRGSFESSPTINVTRNSQTPVAIGAGLNFDSKIDDPQ